MKARFILQALASLTVLGFTASSADAALMAADNASDVAYNPVFNNGTNGGSGFGAWVFGNTSANPSLAGQFVGDSSINGNGASGNINIAGKSWGLYANSNQVANATRPFLAGGANGLSSLAVGESLTLTMDNGFVNSGLPAPQTVGFGLQNSSGVNRFEFYFKGGKTFYDINLAGFEQSTNLLGNGTPFTADGLSIKFTQLAANGWTLDVTPNGGSLKTYSSANFGALGASDISQLRLFNYNNAGGGSPNDIFFNSLAIIPVPEPAHLLFGILAGGCFALRRRRG